MTIGVIGAGAWGTALAQAVASDGGDVVLWAREPELVDEINTERTNSLYLPTASLHETIRATGEIADVAALDTVLVVTPAQHPGTVLSDLARCPRALSVVATVL